MDKELIVKLRIVQTQATALVDSISGLMWQVEFDNLSNPYQQAHALLSQARQLLIDTSFSGSLPSLHPKMSARGGMHVEAQDIRTMALMLNACLSSIIDAYALPAEDAVSTIAVLESKLAETESRSITLKDDELRERCLDLLLRPGKADTAVREAAVVLEHRVRKMASLSDDAYGVGVVDRALSPKSGNLLFPGSTTEREGLHQLIRGTIGFFKNPTSHRIIADYDVTRARQVVGLVDTLLQLLQEAQLRAEGDETTAT
jgi:hypothetical protein